MKKCKRNENNSHVISKSVKKSHKKKKVSHWKQNLDSVEKGRQIDIDNAH